ncbi:MAG: PAS domain S-box protein [Burkholderiaceae bacterium]|nr:PAS domain S-box protein [Burkholderiaceae bacterium]
MTGDPLSPDARPTPARDDGIAQLTLVQQAMGIVTWTWDTVSGRVVWYGDLSGLLGLPRGFDGGQFSDFESLLHPDDRAAARQRIVACLKGEIDQYRAEERVLLPDGSLRWLETYGRASRGADGRTERLAGVVRDVTRRRAVARGLEASEQRFRHLIESAPVAIGISRGDRMVYGNPSFARMFGFADADAVVGTPVLDRVAPRARAEYLQRSRRREAGGPAETRYDLALQRTDGSEITCLVSITEVELADGAATLVLLHDVSDRNRALLALQQERDRARQYLQVAEAILVALDEQARITMLNRKGCQLLGYQPGELEGRNWFQTCLPGDERAQAIAHLQRILAGDPAPPEIHEHAVLTRSGERRQIAWRHARVTDAGGRVVGSLSSGEDITERLRAEAALRALNLELEDRVRERTRQLADSNAALAEARDAAEAARQVKGQFLAHMSHEIRTPMNAIVGMTDLARRLPGLPPRAEAYLADIARAADALLAIINQVLDFSKAESGRIELSPVEFDLDDLLARLRSLIGVQAAEKGLDFVIDTAAEVPRRLVGDALRIGQVLLNLCSNAVKFTDRGQVILGITRVAPEGDSRLWLRFAVRDTGIGIDAAGRSRLFQAFQQVDAATARLYGGTGLGLAISRQLVELMGGRIGVQSEPGVGSEFDVELPLGSGAQRAAAMAPVPAPAPAIAPDALRGARLLLVEDNALNRIVATDLLEGVAGARVVPAGHGAEALQRLAAEPFDAVLMDLQLPGMDGFETTARLRAQPGLARLPVIAMTAHASPRDRERCRAVGMDDCIAKPFDPHDLFAAIARALRHPTPDRPGDGAADAAPARAVDFGAGLQRCMGRRALYIDIVQRYLAAHADDAQRLQAALAAGRLDEVAALAHTVIAAAGAVGADSLSQTARALQAGLGRREAPPPALVAGFVAQHRAVLQALRDHLAKPA